MLRWFTIMIAEFTMMAVSASQCALCKAALQSSGNEELAAGLRSGILLLLIMPYIIVGTIVFAIYRAHRVHRTYSQRRRWRWQVQEN